MTKIVVTVEGGLVQNIVCDQPFEAVVIDLDTEGAEPSELTKMPGQDGTVEEVYLNKNVHNWTDKPIDPEWVNKVFERSKA